VRVLVDAQSALLANALKARPFLVRVNRAELSAVKSARGAEWLVVSSGAGSVEIASAAGRWSVLPPHLKAVNPVGSGDAMMAGIACALSRGKAVRDAVRLGVACGASKLLPWTDLQRVRDAVRLGVACGAANALTTTPGVIRRADVEKLLRRLS
jgi:fructose-1-phosphate kinase PfkB-like protein